MVVFTLVTVPAGIALALLQVLETNEPWLFAIVGGVCAVNEPWLFAIVGGVCAVLVALLLRTRSARVAFKALRRRFTP
ncbi:hypothetical protein [Planomonospora algeriensis]